MKNLFYKYHLMLFFSFFIVCFVLSGCSETIYEDENQTVYTDSQNSIYENKIQKFEMTANSSWDIQVNQDESNEYDVKFVYKNEDNRGNCWISVKVNDIDNSITDDRELQDIYSQPLKDGILKAYGATIDGRSGKWLCVEPIDATDIGIKNENGEELEFKGDNLAKSDANQDRMDCIYFIEDGFSYVFYYYAENLNSYNAHEQDAQNIIGSFKFK